jgi:hypothetical protein
MRLAAIPVLALIVALAAPFLAAPVSLARLTDVDTTAASLGTGVLAAPTALAGTGGTLATLSWTPSTSVAATGYQVLRSATSGSGHAQIGTVTPVSAAATTDSPGNGTWYYILRTYLQDWTSPSSNEASVIVSTASSTGYKGCANNQAETSGSGDNNGYETTPGNACAMDGAVAVDLNSGTGTSTSCTSANKDRHRFWGYTFGMPASVASVNGITVRLDARMDSTTGTNMMCVQLSWDSGATWTTAQTANITSTTIATYILGGAADVWGHAPWTLSQLGSSTFRVRITDVSNNNSRDFRLDYVGVQVHYTP